MFKIQKNMGLNCLKKIQRKVRLMSKDKDTQEVIVTLTPEDAHALEEARKKPYYPIGEQVGGSIIVRKLDEGGMGIVYVGIQPDLGRKTVVKVLRRETDEDPKRFAEKSERFLLEARLLARLDDPHFPHIFTPPVKDIGQGKGEPGFEMEMVEGQRLDIYMDKQEPGFESRFDRLEIAIEIAKALTVIHNLEPQIIHRDLKPENVIITPDGQVKILDFGIARSGGSSRRTRDGIPMGTLEYMSPEQLMDPKRIDHRTDIWSLGAMLYEMLYEPFHRKITGEGELTYTDILAHFNNEKIFRDRMAHLPLEFRAFLEWCMDINPDKRPSGAHEVVGALKTLHRQTHKKYRNADYFTDPDFLSREMKAIVKQSENKDEKRRIGPLEQMGAMRLILRQLDLQQQQKVQRRTGEVKVPQGDAPAVAPKSSRASRARTDSGTFLGVGSELEKAVEEAQHASTGKTIPPIELELGDPEQAADGQELDMPASEKRRIFTTVTVLIVLAGIISFFIFKPFSGTDPPRRKTPTAAKTTQVDAYVDIDAGHFPVSNDPWSQDAGSVMTHDAAPRKQLDARVTLDAANQADTKVKAVRKAISKPPPELKAEAKTANFGPLPKGLRSRKFVLALYRFRVEWCKTQHFYARYFREGKETLHLVDCIRRFHKYNKKHHYNRVPEAETLVLLHLKHQYCRRSFYKKDRRLPRECSRVKENFDRYQRLIKLQP